jgi:hypothetical protein
MRKILAVDKQSIVDRVARDVSRPRRPQEEEERGTEEKAKTTSKGASREINDLSCCVCQIY